MTTRTSLTKNVIGYTVPVVIVLVAYLALRLSGKGEPPARREITQVQLELRVAPVAVHDDIAPNSSDS